MAACGCEQRRGPACSDLRPADSEAGEINNMAAVIGPDGGLLVETGSPTALGGSSTSRTAATELVGPIPEACSGDAFWAVSTVEMRPGGAPQEAGAPNRIRTGDLHLERVAS